MNQLQLTPALDVEAVEHELGILWKNAARECSAAEKKSAAAESQSSSEESESFAEEGALMRARVANLLAIIPDQSGLDEINHTLEGLSSAHPSRALVIVAERSAEDRDIDLYISSFSQNDNSGRARICCEELVFIARGKFVPELPSVALPLLVSDLPTFIWWHDELDINEKMFQTFCDAADRLVIDSAKSTNPHQTILTVSQLFDEHQHEQLGISDINWARLTSWRALLASFYDQARYKPALSRITEVTIDYTSPSSDTSAVAPQAVLFAGWLMSRLGWKHAPEQGQRSDATLEFAALHDDRRILFRLNQVERPDIRPGRLARAELTTETEGARFIVMRQDDGRHLETHATFDGVEQPGRVLPVRNRSTAQLLGRELEILCNDNIYADAVSLAAKIIS